MSDGDKTRPDPAPADFDRGSRPVADAVAQNWVDLYAPRGLAPFMRLARLDRPVGTWLLLWPAWWAIAFAMPLQGRYLPNLALMALFGLGAVAMRGAGCTYNDIVDRDFDAQVARTRSRPLPSGAVSLRGAWVFLVLQCLVGLAILLSLNSLTILLGVLSLAPIALYPFMKRVTYWPQAMLGIAFNWSALMGWSAVAGAVSWPMVTLYLACIFWTLGYDTIYGHQDKEDDALLGLKSTALKFGDKTRPWLYGFYSLTLVGLAAVGAMMQIGWVYYIGLSFAAWQLYRQAYRVDFDDPAHCLAVFRSNRDFGFLVFASILAGTLGSHFSAV